MWISHQPYILLINILVIIIIKKNSTDNKKNASWKLLKSKKCNKQK